MNTVSSWQSSLNNSWGQVWSSFLGVVPQIFGAILVFAIGLVLAFWARRLVVEVLKLVQVEKLSRSLKINKFLEKSGLKTSLVEALGKIVEWLIILVFFLTAVDILGLSAVSIVLTNVLGYVPNIIAAALILGAGYYVAGLVENLVSGAFMSVDHKAAKSVSQLARWLVLVTVFFAAIGQLQIAQGLVNTFFQGLTYTLVLAIGLSVGLGAKDLVARILNDWYEKMKK